MKKLLVLSIVSIGMAFSYPRLLDNNSREVVNFCDREAAQEKCKKALVPYRYSSMKVTEITFRGYNQVKEVTIPLFFDSKYRFVFNTEGLPNDVMVEIYANHSTERKKKDEPLFTATSGEKQFNFEPTEEQADLMNIYVNYLIPAIPVEGNNIQKGCIVLMSGFENQLNFSSSASEETN